MTYLFDPGQIPHLLIKGSDALFPIRRVHCVAKNYGKHIQEMGGDPDKIRPKFFSKSPHNVISGQSRVNFDYPPMTDDFHYELELVVVLGENASIYGYAVGIDFTKRDLQKTAKNDGMPWDTSKNFMGCAVVGEVHPVDKGEVWTKGAIKLSVNGELKQDGDLSEMIYGVSEIIDHLNGYDPLMPGDLIFTGTPAGVGAVGKRDRMDCHIDGLDPFTVTINP